MSQRQQPRLHPSWLVVLAGVCAALHIAKLPPALPVLQKDLGLTLVQAGFLLSAVQMGSMCLGLIVGLWVDAVGLRRSMLLGLSVLSVASILGGLVHDGDQLLLLRVCEGLGFLLTVMPAPALIRRTVEASHLSGRMGWWGTYMPLGSALSLLIGPWWIAQWGWPLWWWMLSLMTLAAALALWWGVPVIAPTAGLARQDVMHRLGLTLRSAPPWWVALSFAAYSSQWLAVIGFLPTIYGQMGLSASWVGALTAVVAVANVSGNIVAGRALQRGARPRGLLQIGFVSMGLTTLLAYGQWHGQGLPTAVQFVSVVLFSAVGGLIPATLFSMAVRLAPSEQTISTTVGYVQQWSAFGQFMGPPLVAWVAAQVGGWQLTWTVTATLCLGGVVLARWIERSLLKHKPLES